MPKWITLIENKKAASDGRELAKIFNEYFSNNISNLDKYTANKKQVLSDVAFPFSFRMSP